MPQVFSLALPCSHPLGCFNFQPMTCSKFMDTFVTIVMPHAARIQPSCPKSTGPVELMVPFHCLVAIQGLRDTFQQRESRDATFTVTHSTHKRPCTGLSVHNLNCKTLRQGPHLFLGLDNTEHHCHCSESKLKPKGQNAKQAESLQ